jgi:hypothetical protein
MCFSPQADFAAGAVVTGMGVEALRRVRVRRELIVGALPLLFGIHQLVEGFVWLGLRGQVSPDWATPPSKRTSCSPTQSYRHWCP